MSPKTEWPHGATLDELEAEALSLVRMIELERSGIRDGGGVWVGDPWGCVLTRVPELCRALLAESLVEFESPTFRDGPPLRW